MSRTKPCPRCHNTGGEWGGGNCILCKGTRRVPVTSSKKLAARWSPLGVGPKGYAAAEALAPIVEKWLEEHCPKDADPYDMYVIAAAVVRQVSTEKGLYQAHQAAVSRARERRAAAQQKTETFVCSAHEDENCMMCAFSIVKPLMRKR